MTNPTRQGAITFAEYSFSYFSDRLVDCYRDLIELKSSPTSAKVNKQMQAIKRDIKEYELGLKREGLVLKYGSDFIGGVIAQCEHYATRIAQAA
jgi:hypothetical protein